jgi:phosphoglycolate phosphatase
MKIKAIIVDIDGTLTDTKKVMFTSGIEALRTVQSKGTSVSIASGNVLPVAYGLSVYMGLNGPVIAENGGMVCHKEHIHQLFSCDVPRQAFEHLQKHMKVERLFTDTWRVTEIALNRSVDLARVRELLQGWEVGIEATGFAIHIMTPGHGKMAGVRKVSELLKIDLEEMAAFGDSDNDVGMLEGCGYGVAVANASEAAKRAADHVTSKPHADGVIEGLRFLELM